VTGLTLAAIGAAGPSGLKAAQLARRAGLAFAVAIVVVLQLVNLVTVPLRAGQVVAGATISTWAILRGLLLLVQLRERLKRPVAVAALEAQQKRRAGTLT
jgi:hypothetical protein